MIKNIFPNKLSMVIFDVDGTLYRQSKLRRIMLFEIISYYLFRPHRYKDVFIIYYFRKERERRAGFSGVNLQEEQYMWCAEILGEKVAKVKKVVDKWIFNVPNRHLRSCMYPGVSDFINGLKKNGIATAIYSDYESKEKLRCMGLKFDLEVSSTDSNVNSFKPLADGLLLILTEMNINSINCLFIGDRFELDGVCAENAGVSFLLIDKKKARKDFYLELSAKLLSGIQHDERSDNDN